MSLILKYLELKENQIYEKISEILLISQEIKQNRLTVSEIFQSLRSFFVSDNDENRNKAAKLIKKLFSMKNFVLSSNDYLVVYSFFLDKIKDIMIIEEAIQIIYIILERTKENEEFFKEIISKFLDIFYNNMIFFLPAYNQKVRNHALRILDLIFPQICSNRQHFNQGDFLTNFLNQIEGEKDPRNLLIVLKIFKNILSSFDRNTLYCKKTEIFDTLECYYPISFNKNAKNKIIKIEKQDLEEALNSCLCHEFLLEKTWELLVEKMRSGVLESQIAGNNTLRFIILVHNFSI